MFRIVPVDVCSASLKCWVEMILLFDIIAVCEEPPDIEFGTLVSDVKATYLASDRVQYSCNPGYTLEGSEWITCQGGKWSPPPKCLGKNCSRPPTLENGDIISSSQEWYPSGSSVEFKCQWYYAMEGPNKSFCDNGSWTKKPACLGKAAGRAQRVRVPEVPKWIWVRRLAPL
uniref:Sushi domain-containing protein n=1 Tax=Varanus komodoensis TaxID=61221 RepID=A0A8D2IRQ1_VARKO